jgi:AAA family ATP:ADP antiporter
MNNKSEFTHLRALFWPIYQSELKKFIPLSLIMFGLLFIYTIARNTKDTLVVNAVGVSLIPFLQGTAVTLAGFLFVLCYAKMTNHFSREKVFYIIISFFLSFYVFFGFVIHPNSEWFHPSIETIHMLNVHFPSLSHLIDAYSCWSYSLFYVITEIWGNAMVGLLFWEFANHIVLIRESKRFYGLFAIVANMSLILSGYFVYFCSHTIASQFPIKHDTFGVSIYLLMGAIGLMGGGVIAVFRWMYNHVVHEIDDAMHKPVVQKKSLRKSLNIIAQSPEILCILVLVLSYAIAINILDMQWKHQLHLLCGGNKSKFNSYMGLYSLAMGISTILCGLFISTRLLHNGTWFRAAIVTPVLFLLFGLFYFIHIMNPQILHDVLSMQSITPMALSAFIGGVFIVFLKSLKYTLFDPTKEMAYIPLSDELRSKGKAVVDVLGNNLGEAGSGYLQLALFAILATKDVLIIAPYAGVVFVIACFFWVGAVRFMARRMPPLD